MGENRSKLGLGILIGVLITLVIGLGGFIIYDKVLSNNNESAIENENNKNEESNINEEVTLNYNIEGTMPNVKMIVNGKYVDVTGSNIEVIGKLKDTLVVKVWSMDYYDYYVVDKNANIVSIFIGKGSTLSNNYTKVYLKGNFVGNLVIENDSLIIDSNIVASEPVYNSCNKNDNDVVEYKEKFTYSNGNFSSSTLVKSTTAKEYRQSNNIKCD